jgi:hypothetical protein
LIIIMNKTFHSLASYWLLLSALFMATAFSTTSTKTPVVHENGAIALPMLCEYNTADFLKLTPRKVREVTGHKMSLKEVIALKSAQHKIKKASQPGTKGKSKTDWKAIVAIISGGLGCLMAPTGLFICPFLGCGGALLGVAGVVFGALALKGPNRTLALIGLIAGGVAILLGGGIFAFGLLGGA